MKNYLGKNDDSNFILSYKIVKDKIVVKLNSHKKYTIPYTKENEENLLKMMQQQAKESRNYLDNIQKKTNSNASLAKFDSLYLLIITNLIRFGVITNNPILMIGIFSALVGGTLSFSSYEKNKKVYEDIEKNLLYLKNEDLINNNNLGNKKITINSIYKMSLKQLKKIVKDAEIEKILNVSSNSISQQTNYSTPNNNKSVDNIVNTDNSLSNLTNQNINNSNNNEITELLNTLSEEEINLLKDMTNNNLDDPNISKYIKMSREEKLEFINNKTKEKIEYLNMEEKENKEEEKPKVKLMKK